MSPLLKKETEEDRTGGDKAAPTVRCTVSDEVHLGI